MGITPTLVSGCWVGGDDRDIHFDRMDMGQGAAMALPIFAIYMKKVYADKSLNISQGDFPRPNIPGVDLDFDCNSYDDRETIEYIDEF